MPGNLNGLRLRFTEYRAQRGLVIEQQALALRYSAAAISEIETRQERPPPGYIEEAARWLGLSESETIELLNLAARPRRKVQQKISYVPVPESALDAPDERRLKKFSALRPMLSSDFPHEPLDAAAAGALARDYLQISGQLRLDLLDVFENWLPLSDPNWGLRIQRDYKFGNRATGYTNNEIYLANLTYSNIYKRQADAIFILGHEIGHAILHTQPRPFVDANYLKGPKQKWMENEADTFAMAFFISKNALREATNPRHLAWSTNTPIKFAHQWISQTKSLHFWEQLEERKRQLDLRIEALLDKPADTIAKQQTEEPTPTWQSIFGAPNSTEKKRSRPHLRSSTTSKTSQLDLPLSQTSGLAKEIGQTFSEWHTSTAFKEVFDERPQQRFFLAPPQSRSIIWFRIHGWR